MTDVLPTDSQERKTYPIYSGFLRYFPRAVAAVAHHSFINNEKHNPGEPLHWSRDKSSDHPDCILRHIIEGDWVSVAWRALAKLEITLEATSRSTDLGDEIDVDFRDAQAAVLDAFNAMEHAAANPSPPVKIIQMPWMRHDTIHQEHKHEGFEGMDPGAGQTRRPRAYIAGPMRGYPMFNFPAFKLATKLWTLYDYDITSPADMDEAVDGLDPIADPEGAAAKAGAIPMDEFVRRDVEVIMSLDPAQGDCLIMLPGWRKSVGAQAEYRLAKWRGLARYDAVTGLHVED